MTGPDIHDEHRASVHDKLNRVTLEFQEGTSLWRKANGIVQAAKAMSDAIIDMVPESTEQDEALEHVRLMLGATMKAFNDKEESESA